MQEGRVHLTKEDKEKFAEAARTADPITWLGIAHFLDEQKERFTKSDWEFLWSHLGRRGEKLLKNVAKNLSFED